MLYAMLRPLKFKMKYLIQCLLFLPILTSCNHNYLEKNYELDYDPNQEINLVVSDNGYDLVKIAGHILFYGHNQNFIIACQKTRDSIYNFKEGLLFDEMMNNIWNTKYNQFWILALKNDSLYGPLNKTEYLTLRKKMSIPEDLKMDYSTLGFYLKGQRNDIEYKDLDNDIVDIRNLKENKTTTGSSAPYPKH